MSENKTIAKNSIILYLRLLVTTVIGLYSSRIILMELGADGFGLYAVVGGLVAMMNFINTSMIATTNRFIAIELGKKDEGNTNKVFNTLLLLHLLFSVFLLLFADLGGVWYINNYLNVSVDKIPDALFVLHLSVISAVIATVIVPFQGLITFHEKFIVRAGLEIINSVLLLGIVLLLVYYSGNKLRAYAVYVLIIQVIITLLYYIYCWIFYSETIKWKINSDWKAYKEVSVFFLWQLVYILGTIGAKQGGTLIVNLFFGTILNAAFSIAAKVNEFVFSFVKNLNQAALPQIMKNYSAGNQIRSLLLVYKLSKYTFLIMLIPSVPILLSIDSVLVLWLKEVPKYTEWFIILGIIHGLVSCLESGFDATIDASGKIRKTKIIFSLLFLSTLPFAYILYKNGFPPYSISILYIAAELLFIGVQSHILSKLTGFRTSDYVSQTLVPVFFVTLLIAPQFLLRLYFGVGLSNLLIATIISVILTITTIYFVGLNKAERIIIQKNVGKFNYYKRFLNK